MTVRARLCFVLISVAAAGCASQPATATSPVSPSPAALAQVANYAGEWTVTYHVDASIGRYAFTRVGRDFDLTLRLRQIGDRVSGVFLSDGLVTDVEGVVDGSGRLSLAGSEPSPIPDHGSLELLRFDASLDQASGLSGTLQYQSLIPGEHSAYSTGATGPVVRAIRTPLAITSFSGVWTGFFNTTQCAGARYCLLDDWGELALELTDTGTLVTGTLRLFSMRIPVSGRVSGTSVELGGTNGTYTVSGLRLDRASTGRATGRATVTAGWSADIDLIGVALAPGAR